MEKKQKTYIIALIDDASRMIVGIDIFFNDNFVNLMSVIRGAVIKYGKPKNSILIMEPTIEAVR